MMEGDVGGGRKRAWRRWALIVGGLGLVGVVLAVVLNREVAPQKSPPLQARLELAAGDVRVRTGSAVRDAASGAALSAGAGIETGRGARALVRMPDGSTVFMRSDSQLTLDRDSLVLAKGEYWVDAPPTDRKPLVHRVGDVEISAAEAGLSIRRDGERVAVYVARGNAAVNAKHGRVEVRAGEQATVLAGKAPTVAPIAFWDDWTGGMADAGAGARALGTAFGSIYGIDAQGSPRSPARRLEISQQAVRAVVRDGLAETEVEQTFFNPGERDVEGWYWFTVPPRATVTGFAVETDGTLVEGEFIERREAAAQYVEAKGSGHSPALLEYIDSSTYRARIFPIAAGGTRRVMLRYLELRPVTGDKLEYVYPMGTGEPVRIGDFSLSVDLGEAGTRMQIATLADARIEQGGKLVTMRRSGYTPRAPFQLEAKLGRARPPLTVARFDPGDGSADYVLARYVPDLAWESVERQRADVVVVVDTSAAGDESARQLKVATAEAILRALSDDDRFALIALDVSAKVLHPKAGLAPAAEREIERALEALADHSSGGATDLAAFFDEALSRVHGTEQPAIVYVGDGLATSGELSGEQIVDRLRRALGTSRARLFAVGVGSDADYGLLGELARVGGGESFRVDESEESTARALELAAAIKAPTVTDFELDLGAGLDEVFTNANGKLSRGTEVTVLARTHHDFPKTVKVRGRLGGKSFEKSYVVQADDSVVNAFVPRLWAAEYVRRLLGQGKDPNAERGRIVKLGVDYGLMTPYTSVLALENELAYEQRGIPRRRSRLRGVRLGALDPALERRLSRPAELFAAPRVAFGCDAKQESAAEATAVAPHPATPVAPPPTAAGSPTPTALAEEPKELQNLTPEELAEKASPPMPRAVSAELAPARAEPSRPMSAVRSAGGAKKEGGLGRRSADDHDSPSGARSPKPSEPAKPLLLVGVCSDAAGRPLANRVSLWRKRLAAASTGGELLARYDAAYRACEIDDWQAERLFLELLQQRIRDAATAETVLARFADRADVKKYLGKLILRRTVDQSLIAAVQRALHGGTVNWLEADLTLQAIADPHERLAKLRQIAATAPGDPNGDIRIVQLLLEIGSKEEALALGRRLRDQGTMTPDIARRLGDVLAASGLADDAVRVYSEIVEFDRDNAASRRLLGDIFLRHRWYDPAYRQYRTLTTASPSDALAWLRLAAAAAGAGRIDEALRLERRVATAEGTPGPSDPRRWARLWSAARLGGLLAAPNTPNDPEAERRARSIERELKELGLFSGPGRLVILTWEDFALDLALVPRRDGHDLALGELTDAAPVALASVLLSAADAPRTQFVARVRNRPEARPSPVFVHSIDWDGKHFKVTRHERRLEPRAVEVEL